MSIAPARAQTRDLASYPFMTDKTYLLENSDFGSAGARQYALRDALIGSSWHQRYETVLDALAWVPHVANSMDVVAGSETFGWLKGLKSPAPFSPSDLSATSASGGLWREGANEHHEYNARTQEPISTLVWAYTWQDPANPYLRDQSLMRRMMAGVKYYLDSQRPEGGFQEYHESFNGGYGGVTGQPYPANQMAPTNFALPHLMDIYERLKDEPVPADNPNTPVNEATLFATQRDRLLPAIKRGVNWATTDASAIQVGINYTNQYTGVFYTLWRLHRIGDAEKPWLSILKTRMDHWVDRGIPKFDNGRKLGYWNEEGGPETSGYSDVTEIFLDRVFVEAKPSTAPAEQEIAARIADTYVRYYNWCALDTLPEMDMKTFITDNLAHPRTSPGGVSGMAGFYNHVAAGNGGNVAEARPFVTKYLMTDAERDTKLNNWLTFAPPPMDVTSLVARYRTGVSSGTWNGQAVNGGYRWQMLYSRPAGAWKIEAAQQASAAAALRPVAVTNFAELYQSANDGYLFVRRPGVYATVHWGVANGKQSKGVGLIWLPTFGAFYRSHNTNNDAGGVTRFLDAGGNKDAGTHRVRFDVASANFSYTSAPAQNLPAGDVAVTLQPKVANTTTSQPVTKVVTVSNDVVKIRVTNTSASQTAVEQIPVYVAAADTLRYDSPSAGSYLTLNQPTSSAPVALPADLARVRVYRGGVQAVVQFQAALPAVPGRTPVVRYGYPLAAGAVYVLDVPIPAGGFVEFIVKKM